MSATFRVVSRPVAAWVQQQTPWPARFLADLLSHTLNHGMPATRPGGRLLVPLGRYGLPAVPFALALRQGRGRRSADLEHLLVALEAAWPELVATSTTLPALAPVLSVLALRRRAGRFVFVFGDGPHPLLVLKPPGPDQAFEEEVLRRVPEGLAPRPLPGVAGHHVQEGLPGRPLWVRSAAAPGWSAPLVDSFDQVGRRLVELAAQTSAPGRPGGLDDELETAVAHLAHPDPAVSEDVLATAVATAAALRVAHRQLGGLGTVTLEHRDLNAQNCMVRPDGTLVGVIDWVDARHDGTPGADVLHLAFSMFEHGFALREWSLDHLVETFATSWATEPIFVRARYWHRRCVVAAGADEDVAGPLLVHQLAARLSRRLDGNDSERLPVPTLQRMLDVVVAAGAIDDGPDLPAFSAGRRARGRGRAPRRGSGAATGVRRGRRG